MRNVPASPLATYRTVEMHAGGEPVRLILDGFPEPRGATVLEKRHDAAARLDLHRRRLMLKPRGHAEMHGALVVPAAPPAAFGALFMHHSGFSTMCGHGTIALGRWAVASDRLPLHNDTADFLQECPCGPVAVRVAGHGASIAFDSVPAFAAALDTAVDVPSYGRLACDIGYGGAFYAILPASRLRLIWPSRQLELRATSLAVMRTIRPHGEARHPTEPDLSFLDGVILTDDTPPACQHPSRHICVFGEGQIDRSATGSGVTARMAVDAARGLIAPGARRAFAGASGIPFDAELLDEERLSAHRAWRVRRLAELLPAETKVCIVADRCFGDQKLYRILTKELCLDYVIRFRGKIAVTAATGENRTVAAWVQAGGRARVLRGAEVTADRYRVGTVICVQDPAMKQAWCLAASCTDATAKQLTGLYGRRWGIECTLRDSKDLRFGMGLGTIRVKSPERRDRLWLINAFAVVLLTLLGAAGEALGYDRMLKTNTVKRRVHSLFRQGCMLYDLIPTMREEWLGPLMQRFSQMLHEQPLFTDVFGPV